MAPDNWGHKARLGVFIVGAEPVPEAEWWAMAPPGVSVHTARITSKTPWATWNADRSGVNLCEDLMRGAQQFAALAADVVVVGHSSSSVLGGAGWDEAVVRRLKEVIGGETKVTTNGQDCAKAMAAVSGTRPFVIIPPWFGDGFIETAREYLIAQGLNPAAMFRHIPEEKWRDVPPGDLYRHLMHLEQNAGLLRDQVIARCPDDADSVLMIGTGLRCVSVIDEVETALGRPVVTANQASLWQCLQLAGVGAAVEGYGRLLRPD